MQCLIVDDHPLTRDGTAVALRAVDPTCGINEAGSLYDAQLSLQQFPQTDLVLLDLDLPDCSGLETLQSLKRWNDEQGIDARIVVLSGHAEPGLVRDVVDQYGTGYIVKATSKSLFQHAIALTLAGGVYIPEVALKEWASGRDLVPLQDDRAASLTSRECEVAAFLIRGFTYKRIARELERYDGKPISDHTVRVHVGNIAWKLGVTENAKAGVMAEISRRGLTFKIPQRD